MYVKEYRGVLHLPISSSVRPLVSGTKKNTQMTPIVVTTPKKICENLLDSPGENDPARAAETYKCSKLGGVDKVGGRHGYTKLEIVRHTSGFLEGGIVSKGTYIVEPVGRAADTDSLGTHAKREHLTNNNPGDWTPGVTEIDGVQPDEDDTSPTSSGSATGFGSPNVTVRACQAGNNAKAFGQHLSLSLEDFQSLNTYKWQTAMPMPPAMRIVLRPKLST